METPLVGLVRKILESPTFLTQTTDQQQVILKILEETGEITRDDIGKLIEERLKEEQLNQEISKIGKFLNGLDYNTFLTFILSTEIRGQHLITLCSSSKKLNEFCNRAFQLENVKGGLVGQSQDQYLFRLLLDRMRIPISRGKTPRQTYLEKTIGGKVIAFGNNTFGQLGIRLPDQSFSGENFYNVVSIPTVVPDLENIVQVSAGDFHSLALDNQGRVWGFGHNSNGELGLGKEHVDRHGLTLNPYLKDIIQVSASDFSLCLDKNGRVWGFGLNETGNLGVGDQIDRNVPTIIPLLKNIVQVSAGEGHSLCLDNQGKVWVFGYDELGQLGLGDIDVDIDTQELPILNPYLTEIVQISAGGQHSLCLDRQGRVWSFGNNNYGQLGLAQTENGDNDIVAIYPTMIPNLNNIVQISAGNRHSLCLDNQGKVWGFGSNDYGTLGLSIEEGSIIPIIIPGLDNIIEISAGHNHSLCLDNQGRVWEFGHNVDGELALHYKSHNINIPTLNQTLKGIFQISASFYSLCLGRP
jgi:alpha-tubulin suppressor-like RCC1 family protein